MKKIFPLMFAALFALFVSSGGSTQGLNKNEPLRECEASLEKNQFILAEPIFVRFRCHLPSREGPPNFSRGTRIIIDLKDKTREYIGLKSIQSTIDFELLPPSSVRGTGVPAEVSNVTYESEEIIDRSKELFPTPGVYNMQFVIFGIKSSVFSIQIDEPLGANKFAYEFLSKYEYPLSFLWVTRDTTALLADFVRDYGETVYGEIAIKRLAELYLAKNELERAKVEFEKLKSSQHMSISLAARESLEQIDRRKRQTAKPNLEPKE